MSPTLQRHCEQLAQHIRDKGPMKLADLVEGLSWSACKTAKVVAHSKYRNLICRIGKDDHGRYIYAAVQTLLWPERGAVEEVAL